MQAQRVFDLPHYRFLNQAREALFREVLRTWKEEMELQTALDAGCGLGHFSGILQELGFRPVAFDGKGWESPLVRSLGINSLPTLWIVDRKGNLRALNARTDREASALIAQLLRER